MTLVAVAVVEIVVPAKSGSGGGNGDGQSDRRGLDGVGRKNDDQAAGADTDAALGEEFAQAFDGAAHAFCAASSLVPRVSAISRADLRSK